MDTKQKISLIIFIIGAVIFAYGWFSTPPVLSFIEMLSMDESLVKEYFDNANMATLLKFSGLILIGAGLVSLIIIRSIKIHKTIKFKL